MIEELVFMLRDFCFFIDFNENLCINFLISIDTAVTANRKRYSYSTFPIKHGCLVLLYFDLILRSFFNISSGTDYLNFRSDSFHKVRYFFQINKFLSRESVINEIKKNFTFILLICSNSGDSWKKVIRMVIHLSTVNQIAKKQIKSSVKVNKGDINYSSEIFLSLTANFIYFKRPFPDLKHSNVPYKLVKAKTKHFLINRSSNQKSQLSNCVYFTNITFTSMFLTVKKNKKQKTINQFNLNILKNLSSINVCLNIKF